MSCQLVRPAGTSSGVPANSGTGMATVVNRRGGEEWP
ncbi:hypothetical protein ABH930_005971 [Kitasatospora sp. GAS204A]|nr:hypothetical protein [Kitasatospora sp. GAS204B]